MSAAGAEVAGAEVAGAEVAGAEVAGAALGPQAANIKLAISTRLIRNISFFIFTFSSYSPILEKWGSICLLQRVVWVNLTSLEITPFVRVLP
jgi:hypothetical protein